MAKTPQKRVLLLVHEDLIPPETLEGLTESEKDAVKTEFDVCATLEGLGHHVQPCGLYADMRVLENALDEFKPHICFNLLEEFHGSTIFDQHVVSYLELKKKRYTGCNPRGLTLARDKALSKKILSYHRIPVPQFAVFPQGKRIKRPKKLAFPLIVKSLTEEGSTGISQASIVYDDEKLAERVEFVHRHVETAAIAEQFIPGREVYVSVMGNRRVQTFPVWEMVFQKAPDDSPRIATGKVKWDEKYRQRLGIETRAADDLPPAVTKRIAHVCKRAYRILGLSGYARMDLRLDENLNPYILEANPNPQLSFGDDFSESIETTGTNYPKLIDKIIRLGMSYRPGMVL